MIKHSSYAAVLLLAGCVPNTQLDFLVMVRGLQDLRFLTGLLRWQGLFFESVTGEALENRGFANVRVANYDHLFVQHFLQN